MKIRPYLTYNGNCQEAITLYKRAFKTEVIQIMRFSDLPPNPDFAIPEDYLNRVVQCTLQFGDDFIRMSDCGPGQPLNDPESERISLAIEAGVDVVQYAFGVLAEDGRVGIRGKRAVGVCVAGGGGGGSYSCAVDLERVLTSIGLDVLAIQPARRQNLDATCAMLELLGAWAVTQVNEA